MSHLKSQSKAKNVHGGEGGVGGVGVSQLEDLDEDQHHHDVHHGRVELEADVGGTDMEDHTEEPLHIRESDFDAQMSDIKILKGNKILRPVNKKPFSEILSGCFHFGLFSS